MVRIRSAVAVGAVSAVVAALVAGAPAADAAAHTRNTTQAPTGLRTSGQSKDALVSLTRPTLSWVVRDTARAERQTAYEVRVSGVPADRGAARTTVWDSRRVYSAQSTGVAYRGPALQADHTYEWTVRTWNAQQQRSAWSAPQRFDVGPIALGDWSASWLQLDDGALARTQFTLPQPVVRARLYLGAQGLVEPHLNGAVVAPKQVLNSSITDYAKRVVYRDLDVTSLLHKGVNALGLVAGKAQWTGTPTVIAQLSVTYRDGTRARFGTGDGWTTSPGPITRDDFYYGESYDARRQQKGWDTAGFDDSAWTAVPVYSTVARPVSLALNRPVTALDETACCGWSRAALVDGVQASTASSEGYHSAIANTADSAKWVQVDLGSSQPITSMTLYPANPTNDTAGPVPGIGFPVRYRVEVSDDPTFATSTTFADRTGTDQPNPGATPVQLTGEATGRYVRVTATALECRGASCTFRLAELGVYGPHVTQGWGVTKLEADTTPPTRIVGTIAPKKVTTVGDARVYDFGQNYVGQVTLSADAPSGSKVTVTKGELLDGSGNVTTSNISFSSTDTGRQTDDYTFDGSGTQTWTPNFNYAGFRYAEVTGLPATTTITLRAQVIHTDVASAGTFDTSNALIDKIQAALLRTQLNDLQTMPLDCPTREKRGWLGDAGDTDAEAMANLDMQALYGKWLGDIRTSINADGSVPSIAPDQGAGDQFFTDPAWGTAFPQIVWDSYVQYGDKTVLRDNIAAVKGWVDYLGTIADDHHIVTKSPGSWGDDWLSTVSTPHVYFQTLFYYLDSNLLANMAAALGDSTQASTYRRLAGAIRTDFTAEYFDAATDSYGTGTQLSNAMPLALGIVPDGHEAGVLHNLVADIAAHGNHVTTGFVGTTYVFQALAAYHRDDIALAIAERTDYPSFGYMLANGPGTIWEKWVNSSSPDGTSSKDHIGLAGSVGQWYYQHLAGITATGAGWRTLSLKPAVVGDLTHVAASQQTVRGTVTSAWKRTGSTLTYRVVVPVGATATVDVPLLGGDRSTVREGGTTIWRAGHAADDDTGLIVRGAVPGALRVVAGSGSYTFRVTAPAAPQTSLTITPAGQPAPVTAGRGATVNAVVEARSTAGGTARVTVSAPAGWTATASPARIALGATTTATLATITVTPPAGVTSGDHTVTVTVRAPDGTTAAASLHVLSIGRWAAGTTVEASSEHAPNVVDGATRTYVATNAIDGDLATFWNDDTQDVYPDTLTITAPSAVTMRGVALASNPDGAPTDFTIDTWDGTNWVTQADVHDNAEVYRWIPFTTPVTTSRVRIVVTGAAASFTRVAELAP